MSTPWKKALAKEVASKCATGHPGKLWDWRSLESFPLALETVMADLQSPTTEAQPLGSLWRSWDEAVWCVLQTAARVFQRESPPAQLLRRLYGELLFPFHAGVPGLHRIPPKPTKGAKKDEGVPVQAAGSPYVVVGAYDRNPGPPVCLVMQEAAITTVSDGVWVHVGDLNGGPRVAQALRLEAFATLYIAGSSFDGLATGLQKDNGRDICGYSVSRGWVLEELETRSVKLAVFKSVRQAQLRALVLEQAQFPLTPQKFHAAIKCTGSACELQGMLLASLEPTEAALADDGVEGILKQAQENQDEFTSARAVPEELNSTFAEWVREAMEHSPPKPTKRRALPAKIDEYTHLLYVGTVCARMGASRTGRLLMTVINRVADVLHLPVKLSAITSVLFYYPTLQFAHRLSCAHVPYTLPPSAKHGVSNLHKFSLDAQLPGLRSGTNSCSTMDDIHTLLTALDEATTAPSRRRAADKLEQTLRRNNCRDLGGLKAVAHLLLRGFGSHSSCANKETMATVLADPTLAASVKLNALIGCSIHGFSMTRCPKE